nr:MAG TPA: hypothetical protein [Caudoviricetes sp.]
METNYQTLSSLAVEVERAGDLSYAAAVWEKAALVARNPKNQNWAECRKAFFQHWWARIKKGKKETAVNK